MIILAIDPGPKQSAWLAYGTNGDGYIVGFAIENNLDLLERLRDFGTLKRNPNAGHSLAVLGTGAQVAPGAAPQRVLVDVVVIERVESYGMAVGVEVFDTVFWSGRFAEATSIPFSLLGRKAVKLNLCGTYRAKDPNIRQALVDRFGGAEAKGTKANPGPLYGVSKDVWSALAIAVTYADSVS
jgi:hypothetical protein